MIADKVLGPASKVGELRRRDVDSESLIERCENVTEMNRPSLWFLTPACRRTENLTAPQTTARQ